jgi:TRAP-type C4-dicarboxylate transport system permease small subunit
MEIENKKKDKFDKIIDAMAFFAGILLLLMTLMITYAVFMRYLNLGTPIWVLQYVEYTLLWMTFLGAAWLLKRGGHIRIDTAIALLPKRIRIKIDIINELLGCFVTLIIVYYGTLHTLDLYQRGVLEINATNVYKYLIFWIIPFGSLALFFQFLRSALGKLRKKSQV